MYGRIPKTLHICSLAAEEAYRRDIKKGMRNLQEGRHALGRRDLVPTARRASCTSATTRAWRTSSARSA